MRHLLSENHPQLLLVVRAVLSASGLVCAELGMPVFCWFGGGLARWPFPVPRCSAVCGLVVGGPGDGARVLGGAWDRDGWSGVRSVTGGWPRVSSATARPVRGPAVSPWGHARSRRSGRRRAGRAGGGRR